MCIARNLIWDWPMIRVFMKLYNDALQRDGLSLMASDHD